mmetsp:Transcript_83229/g.166534  ORF Transcript_83229/g.166534 Transcript_83229/m.166534 type:complete len:205 (-) Transcript_83229:206-820(-)
MRQETVVRFFAARRSRKRNIAVVIGGRVVVVGRLLNRCRLRWCCGSGLAQRAHGVDSQPLVEAVGVEAVLAAQFFALVFGLEFAETNGAQLPFLFVAAFAVAFVFAFDFLLLLRALVLHRGRRVFEAHHRNARRQELICDGPFCPRRRHRRRCCLLLPRPSPLHTSLADLTITALLVTTTTTLTALSPAPPPPPPLPSRGWTFA